LRKRFKNRFVNIVIAVIAIFVIIGITSNTSWGSNVFGGPVKLIVSPFQALFSWIGGGFSGIGNYFGDAAKFKQENEQLKIKVTEQEDQIRKLAEYKVENESLRKALKLVSNFDKYDRVGGNIIAKEPGNWFNTFTIDVGSDDGVKIDCPVVSAGGLVGRVVSVSAGSSIVISIIDPYSKVSGYNSRTQQLVISVRGDINLAKSGKCRLEYVDENIEAGDLIVTSGISGIFPRGLPIGRVTEIHQSSSQLDSYAVIQPSVDFGIIRDVIVLKKKG